MSVLITSRLPRAMIFGIVTGLIGLIISITPVGLNIEEQLGLKLLFKLRGIRPAPAEVVVVSMDKVSAEKLDVSDDPQKWPRSLHTNLIENLTVRGASVIAFDLFFHEPRSSEGDALLARAMSSARNVVLSEYLKRENILDERGVPIENLYIEKQLPPIPSLADAATAVAYFPLPRKPVRVSQYWTFKTAVQDVPTLPAVVFQLFALDVYDEFIQLIYRHRPDQRDKLPKNKTYLINAGNLNRVVQALRDIFEKDPLLSERMLEDVRKLPALSPDPGKKQVLESLIMMYQGPGSRYINFYGPPRTITTIPYYRALELNGTTSIDRNESDFRGKAVFIGHSEIIPTEKRSDDFFTVYSQPDGVDISGVEIAATAFANLLEDMHLRPLSTYHSFIMIFLWGFLISVLCRLAPVFISLASVIGAGVLYFIAALYQFNTNGNWYPIVVPLCIQTPFAFIGALIGRHVASKKTVKHFLPHTIARKITRGDRLEHFKSMSQKVYGTCLITDIEGFTRVSEALDIEDVNKFKKRYFEAAFEPLKHHDLLIEKTTGDGIIAVWKEDPGGVSRRQACCAAVDIQNAVHRFNQSSPVKFPTRIGLHNGDMSLGVVSAAGHYEYDISGDTVNTAQRIEELNKNLGTQILLSDEVLSQLDGFLTREVGKFVPPGKSKPVVVHELLCFTKDSTAQQKNLCLLFAEALDAFRRQSWEEALTKFNNIINVSGRDVPSLCYIDLCKRYRQKPPDKSWDGNIKLDNTMIGT